MNYTGPKVKLSRKIGINMDAKAAKVAGKKPYPPGQHGNSKKRKKMSDYGTQLLEKQRLKLQYNVSEKQMLKAYKEATRLDGNTGTLMMQQLEHRLDALVFRAGFARTMYAARQYVAHGHILVNGKKVDRPSYFTKVNDVISVKPKAQKMDAMQEAVRGSGNPSYLDVNKADFTAKLLQVPDIEDIPVKVEIPLVVEYYSR
ncbi:MAG: 30S ribosomal protein S4 [Candidatus Kapaibacterium sp.]|nr:30S ribosomal protein S4 [Ignavibacteriota bacterium]MCB9221048.1 30S ribosomal protein S4 [Ignavibacteria bacterium]